MKWPWPEPFILRSSPWDRVSTDEGRAYKKPVRQAHRFLVLACAVNGRREGGGDGDDIIRGFRACRDPRRHHYRRPALRAGARPAYKLWVDFGGELGVKKTSAQITTHYALGELVAQTR